MSAGGVKGIVLNVRVTAKGFCFQLLSLFLSLPNLEKNPKHWGKYAVGYYSALKNEVILSCDHMDEPRGHHAQGNKQTPEDKNCVIPLKIIRLREAEQDGGCRGWVGEGTGSYSPVGITFQSHTYKE